MTDNIYQDLSQFDTFTHRGRFEMEAAHVLEISVSYVVHNRIGTSYIDDVISIMFDMWQIAVQSERQSVVTTFNNSEK